MHETRLPTTRDPDHRFQIHGPDGLGDAELLAFLLTRGGPPGPRALDLAQKVLESVGGVHGLVRGREAALQLVPGVGPARARRILALGALAGRIAERPFPRGAVITEPRLVYEALRGRSKRLRTERFWVLSLDARGRKVALEEVARGGANMVHVAARDVFAGPMADAASCVILAHNHPSGDPAPSGEDLTLTEELAHAGELLGIPVRDHVIVGDGRFVSLAELGHLPLDPPGFRRKGAAQR
jgi:DNA repair protein RadC